MCEIIIDGKTVEFEGSVLTQLYLELYRETARHIKICDSVTKIAGYVFFEFESLKSIEIPNSVIIIGRDAFNSCYALENVKIPDSVTYVGDSAFAKCESLKNISIPKSVIRMGTNVFYECDNIRVKIKTAKDDIISKMVIGKRGQITTVDTEGDEYPILTCRNGVKSESMVITSFVDYAGGKLYSGYEFVGDLDPSIKLSMCCYISEENVFYDTAFSGLKRQLEKVGIR